MALTAGDDPPLGAEAASSYLLNQLSLYRSVALAAYAQAQLLLERALAIDEKALGPDHPDMANTLNNLGSILEPQGDLAGARSYYERALALFDKAYGPDNLKTAGSLNNLGLVLHAQGDHCECEVMLRTGSGDP